MSNEKHFLAAIQAAPDAAEAKLVYADWLEERGDPRAEIIRVREELKTLSPLEDTYWDLKDRFRDLRDGQDSDWLAAMQYDAVYRPMFTKFPADPGQRWRLVEEFIELWHEPLTRESGNSKEEISAAETRIGAKLPVAVCQWYELAGHRTNVWSRQDELFELDRVRIDNDDEALLFRSENQGCETWGIYVRELNLADPPVIELLASESAVTSHCNISAFAIQSLLLESMWQGVVCTTNDGAHSAEADRALKADLQRADLPKAYWVLDPVYFYEGNDSFVVESVSDGFTFLATRTQAAYDALPDIVRKEFPTDR